ncbi:helix-turn-helix domain-containing protein [Tepidimonas taiwanensis]|uniref:helix-turn-helix domain-containing protein n=1 Tax=Tepidimonas taiwanensis TaxID=307486 RepID=UPI0009EA0490|nr:helix-turn-helix transcriptional regulator [Tepidimonas taiwanensis]
MAVSLYDPRYQALRRTLVHARRNCGLSQAQVGLALGVGQSHVSKMERGEAFIDVLMFLDWCQCLSLDPAGVLLAMSTSPGSRQP